MVLQDLGSRNATFLNDIRLVSVSRPFEWNDTVRFGYDTCTYRLVETLEQNPPREAKPDMSISAHLLPPAGIPSVTEMDLNRSVRSVSSPQRDGRRGNRSEPDALGEVARDIPYTRDRREQDGEGRAGQRREEFDGIGFPTEEVEEPRRESSKPRSRSDDLPATRRATERGGGGAGAVPGGGGGRSEGYNHRRDDVDEFGQRDYVSSCRDEDAGDDDDETDDEDEEEEKVCNTELIGYVSSQMQPRRRCLRRFSLQIASARTQLHLQRIEELERNAANPQRTRESFSTQQNNEDRHQAPMNSMPQAFGSANLPNFQTIPAAPRFAFSLGNSRDIEEIIQVEPARWSRGG
eukprot:753191-Hanusia_phi.AAC.2